MYCIYVVDTFAWIEYFNGSEQGKKAKDYIEGEEIATPSIVIAEFTDKYQREKLNPAERLGFIKNKSMILDLNDEIAEIAGRLNSERRKEAKGWGLVDSIVLATARAQNSKVVTGDDHFRDLDDVVMIT